MTEPTEPKTIFGCKVVELNLPENVQLSIVSKRSAAILLKGGQILMMARNRAGDWNLEP